MAITLKTRAGSALKATVNYWTDDTKTERVDTTGYTAHLELRSAELPKRVLLSVNAVSGPNPPENSPFVLTEPGQWQIFIGKSTIKRFPDKVLAEVEMVKNNNPEDVTTIFTATILVSPQQVD